MNLKIMFGNSYALVTPVEDASIVVRAFEKGQMYSCSWDGSITKETDSKLSFSFVKEDELVPPSDIVKTLQEEKAASEKRWIDYYNKYTESQKIIKELEDKLARIGNAVSDVEQL